MSSPRLGQSIDSKIYSEVLQRYTQLVQANNLENFDEIRDYPSLLYLATLSNLQALLKELHGLKVNQAFEVAFNKILEEQWRLTQGTALDVFNNPDNVTNSCLKEILKLIYPSLTEEELLLKLAPGIKRITQAVFVSKKEGFKLETEAIHPESLEDVPPNARIAVNDHLLSASSLTACLIKLDFIKKIQFDLEQNYPELYAELIEKRDDFSRLFNVLKQEKLSPREAITRFMNALKFSGSRFSGQELAGKGAERALAHFIEYLDSLSTEVKKQVDSLNAGDRSRSIKQIAEEDLLKGGNCVETASTNLHRILETAANVAILDAKPPQVSSEELQKYFAQTIKSWESEEKGESRYPVKKSLKLPAELTNPLLKNIKIQDVTHLIIFLQNLDAEYLKKLPPAEVDRFVNNAEDLQYVLFHLDPVKQKIFCGYAAQNLKIFSSLKNGVEVLKNATPEQRLLILDTLKDRLLFKGNQKGLIENNRQFNQFLKSLNEGELNLVLPALREALLAPENQHFLGHWGFRRLLFREKASVYLKALGPGYLKSLIGNANELWEWERNLPSLKDVQVLHSILNERSNRPNAIPPLFQAPNIDAAFIKRYEEHKFSQHIVLGEPAEAEEMVKVKPELLNAKEEVIDYCGNHIKMPAYQLPRCVEDDELAEKFEPHIDRLKNASEIKKELDDLEKWIKETGGFEEDLKKEEKDELSRTEKDEAALLDLIKALKKARTLKDPELASKAREEATETFRTYLEPKVGHVIRKGKICNTQLLDQGYRHYDDEYKALGGEDYQTSSENDALWLGVGAIQRSLTTCYLQAIGQSIYNRLEELKQKKPQSRDLEFRYDRGFFFLPFVPHSGFGYEYAGRWAASGLDLGSGWGGGRRVGRTMSSKNISISIA